MNCNGSWKNSARNIKMSKDGHLSCELKRKDGTWVENSLQFNSNHEYHNIDGRFQWIFDNSCLFLIINMKKNEERWESINSEFKRLKETYNCDYVRVEGIDGNDMENDLSAKEILKPINGLLNKTLKGHGEEWSYDGTVGKSFPYLFLNGHFGAKGLCVSNIKCFKTIIERYANYNWYCIVEDDAEFNQDLYIKLVNRLKTSQNMDLINLDIRGFGGACAVLYNQRIIQHAYKHLNPLSLFSRRNEKGNLWDWKLLEYCELFDIEYDVEPLIPSGGFKSEIS